MSIGQAECEDILAEQTTFVCIANFVTTNMCFDASDIKCYLKVQMH